MKFCNFCDNMLYITVQEDVCLKYECKNCNFVSQIEKPKDESLNVLNQSYKDVDQDKEDDEASKEECVMNINYTDDAHNYQQFMNKNIKYDKTLPHVNNIKCPDANCKKETDTIYIKYDVNNMKYIYFCCNCENFWKN